MEGRAAEDVDAIDYVLGDEAPAERNHSPEGSNATKPEGTVSSEEVPECDPEAAVEPANGELHDDSAEAEKDAKTETAKEGSDAKSKTETNVPDKSEELKKELENLQKRLHDTQEAMHRATTERAELQKELLKLKSKQEDDDDWFSEDDDKRKAELEGKLREQETAEKTLEDQKREIELKAAEAVWDAAAAEVEKTHKDFREVVYTKFVPMLDPDTGNAKVRTIWEAERDKSPANAYRIAKNIEEILQMQEDPAGYREKLRAEIEEEYKKKNGMDREITGKAGLDMYQGDSVNMSEPVEKSAIDCLFE